MSAAPSSSPRIVCVSNSASLKHARLGEEIDSFDEVVRFNGFQTKGFQADVGSRTTVWIHSPLVPRTHHSGAPCREILAAPISGLQPQGFDTTLELMPQSVEQELLSQFSFRPGTRPTTGLLGLAYLLRSYETVHVCGWLPNGRAASFKKHYYRDQSVDMTMVRFAYGMWRQFGRLLRGEKLQRWPHDLAAEQLIYETWRGQGRVTPIDAPLLDPAT